MKRHGGAHAGAAGLFLVAACGARSPLDGGEPASMTADASAQADAGPSAQLDAATEASASSCRLEDMSTWRAERFRDDGDYERAAVAVSGVPWVALKVRNGNIVLANVAIDDSKGIVFVDRIEVPGSGVYPMALDVDDNRFVFLTATGINWNGDLELWRVDRKTGATLHVPVGDPPSDPNETITPAIGLAGADIVVAYGRVAQSEARVALLGDDLSVRQSLTPAEISFTAVRANAGAVDVYVGSSTRVHAEASTLSQQPVDPTWQVIGGIDGFLVEFGQGFRMTESASAWSGSSPASQFSPPAVVRTDGARAAFSLETDLTAVVGYQRGADLAWMNIDPTTDAPGYGVGLMPFVAKNRLGVLYLGLEVPHPEQPLRYFGKVCD
jgi:hypothetical protein